MTRRWWGEVALSDRKVQGGACFGQAFRGRSKEKIDIGGDARLFEILQGTGSQIQVYSLLFRIQHALRTGFQAELQHHTPGPPQGQAKIRICQPAADAGKSIPGSLRRLLDQALHQGGADGIVQQMDQGRPDLGRSDLYRLLQLSLWRPDRA